jgi:hypothetical protein
MLKTNARRVDPTKTTGLRQRYVSACLRRLKKLRRDLLESITTRDCFGLTSPSLLAINEPSGYAQFAFTSDARKHDEFMDWLRQQIDLEVLETVDRSGNPVDPTWQDVYVRAAYEKGVVQAVAAAGVAVPAVVPLAPVASSFFFQPVHVSALELLFTRNFEALKDITDTMASRISRELTLGFAQGLSPLQIAKNLRDQVDGIGLVRARTMARTEIIHAHAQATLNVYESMGIEEVGVIPEMDWTTAGDAIVCTRCLAGAKAGPYTIKQARGLIPAHPS